MTDEDDFEEWPIITMNCFNNNVSQDTFRMPNAEELAEERARELDCERELRSLRDSGGDGADDDEAAALARAVTALRVERGPPPAAGLPELRAGLARRLPPDARALLDHPDLELRLPELVRGACALVSCESGAWSAAEAGGAAALLAAGLAGGGGPAGLAGGGGPAGRAERGAGPAGRAGRVARPAALRALHTLLDRRLDSHQAQQAGELLLGGVGTARKLLQLSDALRSGAGPHGAALAARAVDAALLQLLGDPHTVGPEVAGASMARVADAVCSGWAHLAPPDAYLALQLLGRRLARPVERPADLPARARLLHALHVAAHGHEAQRPDLLKVMVAAARLRLLFRAEGTDQTTVT